MAPLAIVALVGCGSNSKSQSTSGQAVARAERLVGRKLPQLPFFRGRTPDQQAPTAPNRTPPPATADQIRRARAQAELPTSLAFWDGQRGLIGGGSGVDGYCAGTISATADGGRTIHVVRHVPGIVDWVATAGAKHAWAHVNSCGKNHSPSLLLGSADGGRTWRELSQGRIEQASFADGHQGIAIGPEQFEGRRSHTSFARLIETSDGGRTWHLGKQRICHGKFSGFTLRRQAVSFPDPNHAWVACTAILGTQIEGKLIYETSDGGKTWKKVSDDRRRTETEDALPQLGYTSGMSFTSSGFGVFYMDGSNPGVTSDGGRHWAPISGQHLPIRPGGNRELRRWQFGPAVVTQPSTIFDLVGSGRHPALVRSDDGGETWVAVREWTRRR